MSGQEDGFFARVAARAAAIDSVLCVGLDPQGAATAAGAEAESIRIIDATADLACSFKPNSAFFEAFGGGGLAALRRVIAHCQAKGAPVILDNKRGDIGSTAERYAVASFEAMGADAVTLSPYLGYDGIAPFVGAASPFGRQGMGCFVLCATSNGSAKELQSDLVRSQAAKPLGLVVGATDLDALRKCRAVNSTSWILAPGVGAQGASAFEAFQCGAAAGATCLAESRLVVPVSRGISKAADARAAAEALVLELRAALAELLSKGPAPPPQDHLAAHQVALVECAVACGALKFGGPFILKSGRKSPYFFNAGNICGGHACAQLFASYASTLAASGVAFDVAFGPAYKGIPLVAGVATALATNHGIETAFAYNRKEAKDHGEGGTLVGAPVKGKRVVLVDDVISAGTAVREATQLLADNGATLVAIIVALDRQELTGNPDAGGPKLSAVTSIAQRLNVPVLAIITLTDLLTYLSNSSSDAMTAHVDAVRAYRQQYGAC